MKADSKAIGWLLKNETQTKIAKETGIAQSKISRIKSKDIQLENLTFEVASKLTEYAEKLQKSKKFIKNA